jgi:hypothetical protein
MAAAAGLMAADARPSAPVTAVKANVLNTPRLSVTIFIAVISCLMASVRWAIGPIEAIQSFEMKSMREMSASKRVKAKRDETELIGGPAAAFLCGVWIIHQET